MVRIGKREIKFRFILVLLIIILSFLYVMDIKERESKTAFIQLGEIGKVNTFDGILIRDEKVVESDEYGKITYLVAEGERVNKGTKILDLFKNGYDDNALSELNGVQQKINDYQENIVLKDIVDRDLNDLNLQISEKLKMVYEIARKQGDGDLSTIEKQLKALMSKRKEYLRKIVQADDYLNGLYAQESQLLKKIENWKTEITAEEAGVVSFCFDGAETLLKPEALNALTWNDIQNIIKGKRSEQSQEAKAFKPLYRLVNNHRWYVVVNVGKNLNVLSSGKEYELSFEGDPNHFYKGKVISIKDNEKDPMAIFLMEEDIGLLINTRLSKVVIGKSVEGLKVPENAIIHQGDEWGIFCLKKGKKEFIPVEIAAQDKKYAIIKNKLKDKPLQVNQEILLNK